MNQEGRCGRRGSFRSTAFIAALEVRMHPSIDPGCQGVRLSLGYSMSFGVEEQLKPYSRPGADR